MQLTPSIVLSSLRLQVVSIISRWIPWANQENLLWIPDSHYHSFLILSYPRYDNEIVWLMLLFDICLSVGIMFLIDDEYLVNISHWLNGFCSLATPLFNYPKCCHCQFKDMPFQVLTIIKMQCYVPALLILIRYFNLPVLIQCGNTNILNAIGYGSKDELAIMVT